MRDEPRAIELKFTHIIEDTHFLRKTLLIKQHEYGGGMFHAHVPVELAELLTRSGDIGILEPKLLEYRQVRRLR